MLVAGLALLTGCLQSFEGEALPAYSILQQRTGAFEARSFSYIDSQGEQQELSCPPVWTLEKRYCESKDGLVYFSYTTRKSRIRVHEIRVDGSERAVTQVSSELVDARRIWVPSDSL